MKNNVCFNEFLKYSSFNVIGMIGLSCYILADTFFVSKGLGANGLTALNLAIPIYSFINGSGLMFGMGGATKFSISRSQKHHDGANQVFTNTIVIALLCSSLFFILGFFFSENLVIALGANTDVLSMSKTYLQVLLMFAPVFMLNNVLLCFVRNDGFPQHAMRAMLIGSLSNIILDYLFIFPLGMGMFGAAFATGLAPIISILMLLPIFLKKKHRFHLTSCAFPKRLIQNILSMGLPSMVTEVSSGIVIIVFNTVILQITGNIGVAAYGIIANLSLVVIAIYTGIAQGIQPLISRNFGIGNISDIHKILKYSLLSMFTISMILFLCIYFGADEIVSVFNSEHNLQLKHIAMLGIKIYFIGCVFAGFNIIISMYFTSINRAQPAHIISLLRGFFIIIPLTFLLSSLFDILGVWWVFPTTEITVSIIAFILYKFSMKQTIQHQLSHVDKPTFNIRDDM